MRTRVGAVLFGLGVGIAGLGQAQSLNFTIRELSKPFGAKRCGAGAASINARGDVASPCQFAGGVVWLTNTVAGLPYLLTWYHDQIVVWPAKGSSRVLTTAAKSLSKDFVQISDTGVVYANMTALLPNRTPGTQPMPVIWRSASGRGATFAVPQGVPGTAIFGGVNASGMIRLMSPERDANWFVSSAGDLLSTADTAPRDADVISQQRVLWDDASGWRVVDQLVDDPSQPQSKGRSHRLWVGDGRTWWRVDLGGDKRATMATGLNGLGEVVGVDNLYTSFYWRPETAGTPMASPEFASSSCQALINANGLLSGAYSAPANESVGGVSAGLWWHGQRIDIDKLPGWPSGVMASCVRALNDKNQVVVNGISASKSGVFTGHTYVLTPK